MPKFSPKDKVKLTTKTEGDWDGWGFDKAIVVRIVKQSGLSKNQQYIIQANEGTGSTMCVKESEIISRK